MKITNLKTVYLSEKEIKEAITCWMRIKNPFEYNSLAAHIKDNKCTYDWEMKEGEILFVVSIDHEIEEGHRHLDKALQASSLRTPDFEDEIELYKTYGGD